MYLPDKDSNNELLNQIKIGYDLTLTDEVFMTDSKNIILNLHFMSIPIYTTPFLYPFVPDLPNIIAVHDLLLRLSVLRHAFAIVFQKNNKQISSSQIKFYKKHFYQYVVNIKSINYKNLVIARDLFIKANETLLNRMCCLISKQPNIHGENEGIFGCVRADKSNYVNEDTRKQLLFDCAAFNKRCFRYLIIHEINISLHT
jgi:hypothetical protein